VVRYIVTDFVCDADYNNQSSVSYGTFENVGYANRVAEALQATMISEDGSPVVLETARELRIHWLRGPDEPKEAIRWELTEVPHAKAIS